MTDQGDQQIEFHRDGGEWTGVYVGGQLVHHGDHYTADEWLQQHVGVVVVEDSPWLVDDHTPRQTTNEIEQAADRRAALLAEADHLAEEMQQTSERVEELRRQARSIGGV